MAGQLARFWKTCTLPIKGLWLEGGGDDTSQPIIINSARMEGRGARSEREGGRRGGKGGRRLPRPRPCSVVGDVRALESGLYLTPNQLRSAVPDKVSSPLPPPSSRREQRVYTPSSPSSRLVKANLARMPLAGAACEVIR